MNRLTGQMEFGQALQEIMTEEGRRGWGGAGAPCQSGCGQLPRWCGRHPGVAPCLAAPCLAHGNRLARRGVVFLVSGVLILASVGEVLLPYILAIVGVVIVLGLVAAMSASESRAASEEIGQRFSRDLALHIAPLMRLEDPAVSVAVTKEIWWTEDGGCRMIPLAPGLARRWARFRL